MVDLSTVDAITGGAFTVVALAWRRIWTTQDSLRREHAENAKDLAEHRLHVAETFPSKSEVAEGFTSVYIRLDRISDKIDGKVDKK